MPATVGAVYWTEGEKRRTTAEELTLAASAKISSAEAALSLDDKTRAGEDLADAREYLSEAISLDGSNAQRTDLVADIELLLLDVLQVQPLYALTTPLLDFPPDARPTRVARGRQQHLCAGQRAAGDFALSIRSVRRCCDGRHGAGCVAAGRRAWTGRRWARWPTWRGCR